MAYDPITGKWTDEDTSVSKRITGLLSKNTDYMKQAATAGNRSANRRGLLNSTMGIQAAESSRVEAAFPIASQESAQAHERGVQGRNIQFQDIAQKRDIEASHGLLDKQLSSRKDLQTAQIAAEKERLGMQLSAQEQNSLRELEAAQTRLETELGSREALQTAQIAAEKERLGEQLSAQERLALRDLEAAQTRLDTELQSRRELQERDIAAAEARLESELLNRAELQQLDLATRERVAQLDRDAQERIANLNVDSSNQQHAAALAADYETSYAQMVSNIMANPDIPAAERQRYLDHAARVRDSNLRLVEQFYSIDLQWGTPGTSGSGGTPGAGPPGGPPRYPGDRLGRRV